jgi:hypothetical protein
MSETLKRFCIQKGYRGREVNAVLDGAPKLGVEVCWSGEALEGCVPVGTVEWCMPVVGEHRIDFFPGFLAEWLRRDVRRMTRRIEFPYPVFVKSAKGWKTNFISRVVEPGEMVPLGDYWVSEPVVFTQEWRYYVADGVVVTTGWYTGNGENEPAPELGIEWPEGFSGAVDFGRLDDGRLALVEAHAPFACGWYGERHVDYAEWLLESWKDRNWWRPTGSFRGVIKEETPRVLDGSKWVDVPEEDFSHD